MKNIVAGILAHVDAGKTTLSESILLESGTIRSAGRVDNGDTFLDTYYLERARGITIFSKQAVFQWKDTSITLLDTPGHVDFSAEMERTLSVMDYAILIISAPEGVQAHTKTLWRLLKKYELPVFIFVNKMDMEDAGRENLLHEIRKVFSDKCIDFTDVFKEPGNFSGLYEKNDLNQNTLNQNTVSQNPSNKLDSNALPVNASDETKENISLCDENIMEKYIDTGEIFLNDVQYAIKRRNIFPCFFGSALRNNGVKEFLDAFAEFTINTQYPDKFGAKVYKISRDEKNNRLTHMKITGGSLRVKDLLDKYGEKVNQIRIYSGEKYETVSEVAAGEICAVTGISASRAGDIIGAYEEETIPLLEPVMTYSIELGQGVNLSEAFKKLKELEEELPELCIEWNERTNDISVKVMGEVQIEVLKRIIKDRFELEADFGAGKIVYKETIRNRVEGVGHFEPLRHYAEVHLVLEPAERGSGIQISSECSEEELAKNWQRLILTHIEEKTHIGVLTGSPITDLRVILKGGRAHTKHTEGGDFRQATYRAIRQGLMQAESVVLEPYYDFVLTIPSAMVGRAMTDLEQLKAHFEMPDNSGEVSVITGYAPVSLMQDYAIKVSAYTKGLGQLVCNFRGYEECHNQEEVIERLGYDVYADVNNTPDSVFCAHGAGYIVAWYEVPQHMHVASKLDDENGNEGIDSEDNEAGIISMSEKNALAAGIRKRINLRNNGKNAEDNRSGYEKDKELEEIFIRTFGSKNDTDNKDRIKMFRKRTDNSNKPYVYNPVQRKKKYLLVDGYNVIFAWKELQELAQINIDAARDRLLDILSNYQGYTQVNLMVVFDAYKVKGFSGEKNTYHNIVVVFTKEAETADAYIERFAHDNGKKYDITVATSDGLEQIIITGEGCNLISAREFEREVERTNELIREHYLSERKNVHEKIKLEEE